MAGLADSLSFYSERFGGDGLSLVAGEGQRRLENRIYGLVEDRSACWIDIPGCRHASSSRTVGCGMTRVRTIAAVISAIGLSVLAGAMPALAGQQVYIYAVIHPL